MDLSRWPEAADTYEVRRLLTALGITANYTGFRQTAFAVCLAAQEPESLTRVSKWLYPDVARHFGTTWTAVERNIRTAAGLAWQRNPKLLSELAGCEITKRPRASQFISILAFSIQNKQIGDGNQTQ